MKSGLRLLTFLLVLAVWAPRVSFSQMLHLDPLPWQAPADSTSRLALEVHADHFFDPAFDWSLNRVLLTVILPGGQDGIFFVRMPELTFDSGQVSALDRWPDIKSSGLDPRWPYSGRVQGFGQPEAGACGPFALPLLGKVTYGAALGLPVGTETLYPFSSTSMPLRIELRKSWKLHRTVHGHLTAGSLTSIGSGRVDFSSETFQGGYHLGGELAWYRGRGSSLRATLDAQERGERSSLKAGLTWWMPWTADGSFGINATREMADIQDRAALWYLTFAWRFDSPRYREGPAKGPDAKNAQGTP